MIKNRKILITGGLGFIGTSLTERLINNNKITVLDNAHRDAMQYTDLKSHKNLAIIRGNVLNRNTVNKAVKKCDFIVHLASIAGVDTVLKMPVTTMTVNIIGTYNLLEAALKESKVKRFIDVSTSEVFGVYAYKVREGDFTSLGNVGEARWTYAVSKLATEHWAHNYYKQYGLPAVSIRPFNIYGPKQVGEGAIHTFVTRAIKNEDLIIHNDGSQIRAWCYIDDFLDGLLLSMENKKAVGEAFNIGNPRSTLTIYNLAKEIIRLSNSTSAIKFVKKPYQDVELRIPDINKARELLGFEPKINLQEGLLKTIEWYESKK